MWNDPLTKKFLPSKFNHILVSTVHTCCWFDLCPELWTVLCTHCKVVQSKSNTQHVVAFNFQNEHFESLFFRPLFYLTFTLCVPCCRFPCFLPFVVFYSIDFFSSFEQLCVFQMLTIYLLAHPFPKRRKSYYGSCVFYSRKSFVWFRFIYTDCIYLPTYVYGNRRFSMFMQISNNTHSIYSKAVGNSCCCCLPELKNSDFPVGFS